MSSCDDGSGSSSSCGAWWMQKDGCKGLGGAAVGYWGRDIYKTLKMDSTTAKQVVNLRDMISMSGQAAAVWLAVKEGNTCSCYKKSFQSSDRKCKTCHGVIDGKVPGYLKWGYHTVWMSATDDDVTLTNVEITRDIKSSKIILKDGYNQGTIESGDKHFTRTAIGSQWEAISVSFERIKTLSGVIVTFSLDAGSTWHPISDLEGLNPGQGTIRFKADLQRDNVDVLSPLFEIVRARYAEIDLAGDRGNCEFDKGPFIRVMENAPPNNYLKSESGDFPSVSGYNFWTVGLSAFDPRISPGSEEEMLRGPNVVLEMLEGAQKGRRALMTSWTLSDPRGYTVMTQSMALRIEDPVGPLSLVW